MQFSFNSIFELRWAQCKDVFITSCLSKLPQRPQPVFLNNFSPFYYKSARTWEVLLWISFQSDLKVFIDSLKLIFPRSGFAFCAELLQSGQVLAAHDKNNFCFRFAARETNDASKQNYNAEEETLHVKWKFMPKLRVYACILAILLAVANDFINFVCRVPKGGLQLERKWSNLRCVISAPRVNFVRETSFHVRLSHSSSV